MTIPRGGYRAASVTGEFRAHVGGGKLSGAAAVEDLRSTRIFRGDQFQMVSVAWADRPLHHSSSQFEGWHTDIRGAELMLGEPHDLLHEFPELEGKIADLRESNPDFAHLMTDYDDLDARVRRIEELGNPVADETIEELKKERLVLKDRLYTLLRG